tara:strand:- start:281 stop:607 length:327 start_codon:yes stop_codon:yes gene_type:complete
MRKVTADAIRAFRNNREFRRGNTQVRIVATTRLLLLHGNTIAKFCGESGNLWITSAGWQTVTTKERLNGFPTINIIQKDFVWFLNGEAWNGDLIEVKGGSWGMGLEFW